MNNLFVFFGWDGDGTAAIPFLLLLYYCQLHSMVTQIKVGTVRSYNSSKPILCLSIRHLLRKKKENTNTSFGTLTLSPQSMLETALQVLSDNDAHATCPQNDVSFDASGWESLNIVSGSPAIVDVLGEHATLFGRLYLSKLLTSPTTNISRIKNRQKLIIQLQLARSIRKQIKEELHRISGLQNSLLSLVHTDHPLYHDDIRLYHHKWILRSLKKQHRITENITKLVGDAWFSIGPAFLFGGILYNLYQYGKMLHCAPAKSNEILSRTGGTKRSLSMTMGIVAGYSIFSALSSPYLGTTTSPSNALSVPSTQTAT